jgi:hypothetical protein
MPIRLFALALIAGVAISAPTLAAEHAHHGHDAPASLTLDQGRKWPTDEPLRRGMNGVRGAMAQALPAIHTDKAKPQQYRVLAGTVRKDVAYIVANCHLAPEADAVLHVVIAELLAGADAMEGKPRGANPQSGAIKVIQALDDYGSHFDHPGWQPLAH